jgi:hypothetical protein
MAFVPAAKDLQPLVVNIVFVPRGMGQQRELGVIPYLRSMAFIPAANDLQPLVVNIAFVREVAHAVSESIQTFRKRK